MNVILTSINAKYIHSNLAVYCLRAFAKPYQDEITVAEYTINQQTDDILMDLYKQKPDLLCFSCYIWNIEYVERILREIKKLFPSLPIWLGGPEVSYDAKQVLLKFPEVTGIMRGEGEETFLELLDHYHGKTEDLSQIQGITYRHRDQITENPWRPVMDLSMVPFVYHHLEDFQNKIIYYESSRGCPFSCSYCLSSVDKSVRFRELELVKKELDYFLENRVPQVKFVDRTFNCRKSHAMEIWRHIKEHDNGVTNFHFEIAADLLDDEELELIGTMRPGLIQLEIGVQSTNPKTIREIHRVMDLERLRKVVARINAGHNVHQHLDLIAGLPWEDYSSFHQSFNEVYAMEPEQLQLGFLKVLKGSFMFEQAENYGLIYRDRPPYEVLSTRWLSYDDVLKLKGIEDMVEVYYNSGQFTRTLKHLETRWKDAFVFYEQLADYYERKGLTGLNHSRLARYEILHDFVKEQADGDFLMEAEDALMCDLYLRENAKSRPSFALDQSPYKERIRRLAPELRGLGTRVHAEVLRSGNILLFDYRKRDPLTHNAEMSCLEPEKQPRSSEGVCQAASLF